MLRTLRQLFFGRLTLTALVVFVVAAAWLLWWSVPQGPAEIRTFAEPLTQEPDFGPGIPITGGMYCGTGVDFSKLITAPDPTWTVTRQSDGSLRIAEAGTQRLDHTLPPADYCWITGSQFGRRMAAQVGEHFQVWDIESGRLLGRWRAPAQRFQLTLSGRHITTARAGGSAFDVLEVDGGRQVMHLKSGVTTITPDDGSSPAPIFEKTDCAVFSPDGQSAMLLTRSADGRDWLWLWDLSKGVPRWRLFVGNARKLFGGSLGFDRSGRYLTFGGNAPYSLIDLSTSPPTDLSDLVAGIEPSVILADRRALAVQEESGQLNCRIWDLDSRRQIGNFPMYSIFTREPIRSPDDRLIVLQEPPGGSAFEKLVNQILEWIGRPIGNQACYRVVELETGQTVNRFVTADRLVQFDADLQSVWCDAVGRDAGREVWVRFSLRGGGPPWWLWGATAAGGLVSIGCLRRKAR